MESSAKCKMMEAPKALVCRRTGAVLPDIQGDLEGFIQFLVLSIQQEALLLPSADRSYEDITSKSVFEKIQPELEGFNAKFLAHGYFRATFKVGDWVVKCVLHPDFTQANDAEFEFLEKLPPKHRDRFPEMYEVADGVIVQGYYSPNFSRYLDKRAKIVALQQQLDLADMHSDNVGFDKKGNFVFIDFSTSETITPLLQKRRNVTRK